MVVCKLDEITIRQRSPVNTPDPIILCGQDPDEFISIKHTKIGTIMLDDLPYFKYSFIRKNLGIVPGTRMRLRPLIGVSGSLQLPIGRIYIIVSLRFAGDAIALVQT